MTYLTCILFIAGMCIELAGLLGLGATWAIVGALLTLAGGLLWGIAPTADNDAG